MVVKNFEYFEFLNLYENLILKSDGFVTAKKRRDECCGFVFFFVASFSLIHQNISSFIHHLAKEQH
jgi:hypothetical protein